MTSKYILLIIISTICVGVESISNGSFVSIKESPYYVSIANDIESFCGGSIISEYWIVSAAHCFENTNLSSITIRSGTSTDFTKGVNYDIAKVFIPGGYDSDFGFTTGTNDISLIKLKRPIAFNEYQQPIQISRDLPKAKDKLTIFGLGNQGSARTEALVLKTIELEVVDQEVCQSIWEDYYVTNDVFCAGSGTSSTCSGDSGGPVVINGKLAGIVSSGPECKTISKGKPAFYVRIHKFYDWIIKHTGINY